MRLYERSLQKNIYFILYSNMFRIFSVTQENILVHTVIGCSIFEVMFSLEFS